VRGNLFVAVYAKGAYASQAEPIAKRLDEMIKVEQRLTAAQLRERRPSVQIGSQIIQDADGRRILRTSCDGEELDQYAGMSGHVNGVRTGMRDGWVLLPKAVEGNVQVHIKVVGKDLLVGVDQKVITVPRETVTD